MMVKNYPVAQRPVSWPSVYKGLIEAIRTFGINRAFLNKMASHLTKTRCHLQANCNKLKFIDVLGNRPSVALFNIKAHPLTFHECLEAG